MWSGLFNEIILIKTILYFYYHYYYCYHHHYYYTLPEANSKRHLQMDGFQDDCFLLGPGLFSGASFEGGYSK